MKGRRVALSQREDGYIISTVKSFDNLYGKYETAFWLPGFNVIRILEGYNTIEEAEKGHEKYLKMSEKQLINCEVIE